MKYTYVFYDTYDRFWGSDFAFAYGDSIAEVAHNAYRFYAANILPYIEEECYHPEDYEQTEEDFVKSCEWFAEDEKRRTSAHGSLIVDTIHHGWVSGCLVIN